VATGSGRVGRRRLIWWFAVCVLSLALGVGLGRWVVSLGGGSQDDDRREAAGPPGPIGPTGTSTPARGALQVTASYAQRPLDPYLESYWPGKPDLTGQPRSEHDCHKVVGWLRTRDVVDARRSLVHLEFRSAAPTRIMVRSVRLDGSLRAVPTGHAVLCAPPGGGDPHPVDPVVDYAFTLGADPRDPFPLGSSYPEPPTGPVELDPREGGDRGRAVQVLPDRPAVLRVVVQAPVIDRYADWRLVVDYTERGRATRVAVQDGDRPFRLVGGGHFGAYHTDYYAWCQNGIGFVHIRDREKNACG
jgi:hypothetical protein